MIGVHTLAGPKRVGFIGAETPDGPVAIGRVSILTASGSKTLFDAAAPTDLAVAIAPEFTRSAQATPSETPITTPPVTATSSGHAPFSFAWEFVSGTGTWSISVPTPGKAQFTCPTAPGATNTATFEVTVTDALGRQGVATVNAEVRNYGDLSLGYSIEP